MMGERVKDSHGTPLYSPAEAAARLNVTERWIRRAIFEKRLPYVKVGRYVRIEESALDALIEDGRRPAAQAVGHG